jgi:hypothetical protein
MKRYTKTALASLKRPPTLWCPVERLLLLSTQLFKHLFPTHLSILLPPDAIRSQPNIWIYELLVMHVVAGHYFSLLKAYITLNAVVSSPTKLAVSSD